MSVCFPPVYVAPSGDFQLPIPCVMDALSLQICDHSNNSHWVLSANGTVYCAVQIVSNCERLCPIIAPVGHYVPVVSRGPGLASLNDKPDRKTQNLKR